MRHTYLVCYDIRDERRLRRVFKICRNYGNHLQYSIFECDLNAQERLQLENELSEVINHKEDQVLFVDLGPADRRTERLITALGVPYTSFDSPCFIY